MSTVSSSTLIVRLFALVSVVAAVAWLSFSYNALVDREEAVFSAWSQVESTYQRRADLVPNLVSTVRAYADHERQTLAEITQDRALALDALVQMAQDTASANEKAGEVLKEGGAGLPDEGRMKSLSDAQKSLSGKMEALMAVAEDYPALRAADNFLVLQDQLEGAENRINTARMSFNAAAGDFNAAIRRLPGRLLAPLGGFQRKAYFEADSGAEKAPQVNFGK